MHFAPIVSWGKIVNSIDVAQSETNSQASPLINQLKTVSKTKKNNKVNQNYLEELGINSQQFRTLFDNLPQGVAVNKMVYDSKGKPVDFILLESNKAYANFHSFKRMRITNKATEFNPEIRDDQIDWIGAYARVATTGVPEFFETFYKSAEKWYQIYVYSPKKTFFVSVFTDITEQKKQVAREFEEQKKAKQQLLFSERKYRRLYQTTLDGIMARDLHGDMIDCNIAYAKMLGYSKKELKNLTIKQLLPEKWFRTKRKNS